MNFLEALKQPIGTEFIEENTKDYYVIDNIQHLSDAENNDITLWYGSLALSQFIFTKI